MVFIFCLFFKMKCLIYGLKFVEIEIKVENDFLKFSLIKDEGLIFCKILNIEIKYN